jgi:hypothetical protein
VTTHRERAAKLALEIRDGATRKRWNCEALLTRALPYIERAATEATPSDTTTRQCQHCGATWYRDVRRGAFEQWESECQHLTKGEKP